MLRFEKVNLRKLLAISRILASSKLLSCLYIKKKFNSELSEFDYVLDFLLKGHFIRLENKFIILEPEYQVLIDNFKDNKYWKKDFQKFVLSKILNKDSFIYPDLKKFIEKFETMDGGYQFVPKGEQKRAFSNIRNFLLDFEFIYLDKKRKAFILAEEYVSYFYDLNELSIQSLDQLQESNRKRSILGSKAEKVILDYEKKRLRRFPQLADKIRYFGDCPLIGYDILSFENDASKESPRYIEVKAVSKIDFKFYWSRNEINKAKSLKCAYYLYLLPVKDDNNFIIDGLQIIQDPFNQIFQTRNKWKNEVELISVSL